MAETIRDLRAENDRLRAQLSEVEALRASEAQTRENTQRLQTSLAAGAIIGSWNWNFDEDFFTFDEGFALAFGHPASSAQTGLPIDQVLVNVHPEDRPGLDAAIADTIARGGSYARQYRVRRVDGVYYWLEANGRIDHDEAGKASRFPGFIINVDERRSVETERDRFTAELRTLRDALEHQVAVARADAERVRLTLAAGAIIGTWFWDIAADRFTIDEAFAKAFGLDPALGREGIPLAQIVATVHPDDQAGLAAAINDTITRGGRYAHQYRVLRHDGRYHWLEANGQVEHDPDGNPLRFSGVLLDVEERRAVEAERERAVLALRELNADLERKVTERALARGKTWQVSPNLLVVLNAEGRFEAFNPAWTTTLGWSTDELDQTAFANFVHPDDQAATQVVWLDAIERGLPALRFENRYRHKDGSWHWLAWVGVPDDGKVYCSARDITTEKEQAENLRQTQARAATYFNVSEDYLFLVQARADGAVLFEDMNPACERSMGLVRADILGRSVADLVPDNSASDISRHAHLCVSTRQPQTYIAMREYQDGHKVIIEGRATFVETQVDGSGLVLFTGRDVTEQRTTEDALRQSQKLEAVGQLTGGVAHDFNNLLTVIKSSTDLLKRPNLPEERRTRYIGAISETVDRAAKLTGQLLAFARRQALKPEVFSVSNSVSGLADMMRTLAGSRVQISTDLPPVPFFVNADASQFDTTLVNLAVNARDAMNGEGRITIRVHAVAAIPATRAHPPVAGDFVAVALNDTGFGIPAEVVDRIFEPFFTTKEVGKGTGLGLSQVFGFAKQSGGDVTVDSTVGKGTTFTLFLPRVSAPSQVEVAKEAAALIDGHGTRVLVVEDNIDVGTFAVQSLSDLGYVPTLAADGAAALAELVNDPERFDVVFSDVMMPGMSGIELGQEIRRLYHDLPVVLTSGYSHILAQNGTYGFELLHKPYSIEQLSQILRKSASWQRRKRLLVQ